MTQSVIDQKPDAKIYFKHNETDTNEGLFSIVLHEKQHPSSMFNTCIIHEFGVDTDTDNYIVSQLKRQLNVVIVKIENKFGEFNV